MVKLIGYKKVKAAVFISGTGSNLKSLIIFSKKKKSPISIDLIVSNNPKAKGLILLKHGHFTWGKSAKESYSRLIEQTNLVEDSQR